MSQGASGLPAGAASAVRPLGVIEAVGMGWRLMMSDFWRLWLPAFVVLLIMMAASNFGIVAAIVVQPPLLAGLYWVVARKMDGGAADVGDIFNGFKERFGQSVLAMLPVSLAGMVLGLALAAAILLLLFGGMGVAGAAGGRDEAVAVVVIVGLVVGGAVFLLLMLAVLVFSMFFTFALPAVWDHPESGWEAAKASMRMVRERFWSVLGLTLLYCLISSAANLAGLLACCVGVLFTTPVVLFWQMAAVTYLYRSWTGRPLGQGA